MQVDMFMTCHFLLEVPLYEQQGCHCQWSIARLNPRIPRIFELSKWNINLESLNSRASKIISNDIKPEAISCELKTENPSLNFCAGVCVGENQPTNFSLGSKDAQESFIHASGKIEFPKNQTKALVPLESVQTFEIKKHSRNKSRPIPDPGI